MKKTFRRIFAAVMVLTMLVSFAVTGFAKSNFDSKAYVSVVTVSDLQDGDEAFARFGRILTLMKKDGLKTPHSVISGGDYSKMLPDYATPGVVKLKAAYSSVYPEASTDTVACIQGNHDFISSGFTKSGLYDMGAYNLYVINENDFPWNQFLRIPAHIKNTANKLDKALTGLIDSKDYRPVIIVTHVPLHHSQRTFSGDNMYSAYLFEVVNKAAKKLDIVFLFGHNHSGDHDDYIGGSVNFMAPGDKIRIPLKNKMGKDCYTEEKLNFTYTNCGYCGYSNNGNENGSTDALTVGAVQFSKNNIHFVKYSEDGLFKTYDVARKTNCTEVKDVEITTTLVNDFVYFIMSSIIEVMEAFFAYVK